MGRTFTPSDTRFLTVPEVATELRLSEKTVKSLIGRGSLPAVRVGRSLRIERVQFDRWLDSAGVGGRQ